MYRSKDESNTEELIRLRHECDSHKLLVAELRLKLESSATKSLVDTGSGADTDLEKMRIKMTGQLDEFDSMKVKLMKDLQDRCAKVVELEISLDEIREEVYLF